MHHSDMTCPFTCFLWISEQTAIISLHSNNWLVVITDKVCVYCAVWVESLKLSGLQRDTAVTLGSIHLTGIALAKEKKSKTSKTFGKTPDDRPLLKGLNSSWSSTTEISGGSLPTQLDKTSTYSPMKQYTNILPEVDIYIYIYIYHLHHNIHPWLRLLVYR